MGKTRDLFKKVRDTKRTFRAKMGTVKDRNGMDLTEAEDPRCCCRPRQGETGVEKAGRIRAAVHSVMKQLKVRVTGDTRAWMGNRI